METELLEKEKTCLEKDLKIHSKCTTLEDTKCKMITIKGLTYIDILIFYLYYEFLNLFQEKFSLFLIVQFPSSLFNYLFFIIIIIQLIYLFLIVKMNFD